MIICFPDAGPIGQFLLLAEPRALRKAKHFISRPSGLHKMLPLPQLLKNWNILKKFTSNSHCGKKIISKYFCSLIVLIENFYLSLRRVASSIGVHESTKTILFLNEVQKLVNKDQGVAPERMFRN